MPTPGLSLVGFMDQATALWHLKEPCVPANPNAPDAAFIADWQAAQTRLGLSPVPNPGVPQVLPLPAAAGNHLAALMAQPWLNQHPNPAVGLPPGLLQIYAAHNPQFMMVEIDPLLAFQFTVDTARSAQHCGHFSNPPTLDELLAVCLPPALPVEPLQSSFLQQPQHGDLLIRSRNLNVMAQQKGLIGQNAVGLTFGPQAPLVHVVQLNGRYYLHNGFHRVYGCRMAGATHIPCLVRDVPDAAAAALRGGRQTFSEGLLTSADPPVLAHFTQGRAHSVQLRRLVRILHVTWADHVIYEE